MALIENVNHRADSILAANASYLQAVYDLNQKVEYFTAVDSVAIPHLQVHLRDLQDCDSGTIAVFLYHYRTLLGEYPVSNDEGKLIFERFMASGNPYLEDLAVDLESELDFDEDSN